MNWIAVDWGTSRLRIWAMGPDDRVLAARESYDGMGALAPGEFEPALLALVDDLLPPGRVTDVIACGMVGAREGWSQTPYASVPCAPASAAMIRAPAQNPRLRVYIAPGLSQADPADVMRGEETQIAGFLAQNPQFDGAICLPGTHCKWADVSGGIVRRFQTCMTGEMFQLLSTQSVLRHGVAEDGWRADVFSDAVSTTLNAPETLAAQLFALRAEGLLAELDSAAARSRLSGLLIGAELASVSAYWRGRPVAVIGASDLAKAYAGALSQAGAAVDVVDGVQAVLDGLTAARALLRERT